MIKEPRILFTPSKEFRQNIIQQLKYQNGGVLEEGDKLCLTDRLPQGKGDFQPGGSGSEGGEGEGEGSFGIISAGT